jgi:hypothetical protein
VQQHTPHPLEQHSRSHQPASTTLRSSVCLPRSIAQNWRELGGWISNRLSHLPAGVHGSTGADTARHAALQPPCWNPRHDISSATDICNQYKQYIVETTP